MPMPEITDSSRKQIQIRRLATGFSRVFVSVLLSAVTSYPQGLPRTRPEDVGLSSNALQRISPAIRASFLDSGKVAGFIVAVARHGKLAYLDTVGFMNLEQKLPMRSDAVFRIYSMTKQITTVAVLQLIERGKLRLDDPVKKYIPAFAQVKVRAAGKSSPPVLEDARQPITIEHLLTHTAGLTYGADGRKLAGPTKTIAEFADSLPTVPLLFQPGSGWNYSFATDMLGRIVEVVSGKQFDRYLEDEILIPLGMHDTHFRVTPTMEGRITTLYSMGDKGKLEASPELVQRAYRTDARMLAGGSGLLSTVADYLRLTQMLLNGGTFEGKRILKSESVAQMMTNHIPNEFSSAVHSVLASWPLGHYGFGYSGAVRVDSSADVPGSPGTYRWGGYASTFFWIDPAQDLIAMIWTQVAPLTERANLDKAAFDNIFQRLVYDAVIGK